MPQPQVGLNPSGGARTMRQTCITLRNLSCRVCPQLNAGIADLVWGPDHCALTSLSYATSITPFDYLSVRQPIGRDNNESPNQLLPQLTQFALLAEISNTVTFVTASFDGSGRTDYFDGLLSPEAWPSLRFNCLLRKLHLSPRQAMSQVSLLFIGIHGHNRR